MSGEQFAAFLQKHWSRALLAVGTVLLIGAAMDWSWLCDPTGKPCSQRYGSCEPTDKGGRLAELGKSRRAIFFLLGVVLIAASGLGCYKEGKMILEKYPAWLTGA